MAGATIETVFAFHRRNVIIAFAGPAAQRKSHPRSNVWHSAKFDRESWEVVADCLFNTFPMRRKSFLQEAAAQARQLVDEHWLAIERVARALNARRALSGFAIEGLVAEAADEWRQVSGYRPGLEPFAYARERALASQGLPTLRRAHVAAAALRATIAGAPDIAGAVVADLTTRGYPADAVTAEWTRARETLAS